MSQARPNIGASAPAPCSLHRHSSSRGASHSGHVSSVVRSAGAKPADSFSGAGGEKIGVIVVDHGSRRQASNLLLVGGSLTQTLAGLCIYAMSTVFVAFVLLFRKLTLTTSPCITTRVKKYI